ncbi:MAG: hypothetical protein ACNA8R_01055 [Nitriliruptoraceae bacterium]
MTEDFDERAATWDDEPEHLERAHLAAALIRRSVPLTRATRLLEYGAGTGLLSEALANDVGHVIVTDPSAGMRSVLLGKHADGAFGPGQVLALDLARDPVPDLEEEDGSFHDEGFDGHHGFPRERLTAELEAAGFTGVAFRDGPVIDKEGRGYPLLLCTAVRGER